MNPDSNFKKYIIVLFVILAYAARQIISQNQRPSEHNTKADIFNAYALH